MITRAAVREDARLFLHFGVVGMVGFLVDAALLEAGLAFGLTHEIARLISVLIALQVTFLANGVLVFKHGTPGKLLRRWPHYMLSNGFSALCNYAIFVAVVHSRAPFVSNPLCALVIATGIAMFISFAGVRWFVFRSGNSADGA